MKALQIDLEGIAREPPKRCKHIPCQQVVHGRANYCCNAHRQAAYRERIKDGMYIKPRKGFTFQTYGMCKQCYEGTAIYPNQLCGTCHMEIQAQMRKEETHG